MKSTNFNPDFLKGVIKFYFRAE